MPPPIPVVPKRAATSAPFYGCPPQLAEPGGAQSWITRAANLVVTVSKVEAGAVLERKADTDEYLLALPPGLRARVQTFGDKPEVLDASGDSLTIIPPGHTSVTLLDGGTVTRVFSTAATDLLVLASNADIYTDGAAEVTPLPPVQMPADGWRLRHYRLAEYSDPAFFARSFRSNRLMINFFDRSIQRRDPHKLTPHSHDDHEQISLALEGNYVHHLRTPWTPDISTWREDQHVELGSPSAMVIPAGLIHTTQDVGEGTTWLVDVFAPPRKDFLGMPGFVRNASEYPAAGA